MYELEVQSERRTQLIDITQLLSGVLRDASMRRGLAVVYVPHTTAGLTINENADPAVCRDLLMTLEHLAPGDLPFAHAEGNSDAHVKASLVGSSVTVPVEAGRLQLGTWQGVFFAEFDGPRRRQLWVQLLPSD